MNPAYSLNIQEKIKKLLANGLLFCSLRNNENTVIKLKNLEKNLKEGADVNAVDANDNNNTPLHIAVEKDEPEVIEFMLKMGADVNAINKNKFTSVDLVKLLNQKNKNTIIAILESALNISNKELNQVKIVKAPLKEITSKKKEVKVPKIKPFTSEIRPGTAGISGQLYETKLIGLLLHRAIQDTSIEEFYLGSNLNELGAFDDIVFKYCLSNEKRSKICFIQAKHKANQTKEKLTVNSVLKSNSDFSLDKYFESYMAVRKKIQQKNHDTMFTNVHISDCCFIIYTPVVEQFSRRRFVEVNDKEKDTLLSTNNKGKIFMYDYDTEDIDILYKKTLVSRAKSIAKAFAKYIVRHKYKNMFLNEWIKKYHVFLTRHVLDICNESSVDYLVGSFSKSFLVSKYEIFVVMRETIIKEFNDKESSNFKKIHSKFKLPKRFGNFNLSLNEAEYLELTNIVRKLMQLVGKSNHLTTIVIDNTIVGRKNTFNKRDLATIGYLVGETLIQDSETGYLKFNTEEPSSETTKRVLNILKLNHATESDIKNIRLDIIDTNFPQLELCNVNHTKKLITEFLNKFKFYTDQENEEGVESILKKEINDRYISENEKSENFYVLKGDAIYLQYHDRVQKWWKNSKEYIVKSCNFYEEAKRVITDYPLININSYVYLKKIKDYNISFNVKAVNFLELKRFMSTSNAKLFHIVTKDKIWTSVKVVQYFSEIKILSNCKFIDLDVVTADGYIEAILSEISDALVDVIVIVVSDITTVLKSFVLSVLQVTNKLIVLSHSSSLLDFQGVNPFLEQLDQNNSLWDLESETKSRIIKQKSILFQGYKVSFASIVDDNMQSLVREMILHSVISNDIIVIGKEVTKLKEVYVDRYLCRCLYLKNNSYPNDFDVLQFEDVQKESIKRNLNKTGKEFIIILNDQDLIDEVCEESPNANVHWFCRKDSGLKWIKSTGSLQKIRNYLYRIECPEDAHCLSQPKSLKHLNDRVVLISGGPGMGKSTFITHLMMQTKYLYKSKCVIKLNLLDLKNEFSTWQKCNFENRLLWFLTVLYKSFSIYNIEFFNSTKNKNFADALHSTFIDANNQIFLDPKEVISKTYAFAIFEYQTFLNMYNDDRIFLILDGFDEICPYYKNEAFDLFKTLLKSRVQRLWITSRPSVILDELELELNTLHYTLKYFSRNDQICFMERFLKERQENNNFDINYFFNVVLHKINCYDRDFTATPLHLHMIAETYVTPHLDIFSDTFNLKKLYDAFIEIKFHNIRFGNKMNCLCYKHPNIRMVIESEYSLFIENHKKLAAYALLHGNNEEGIFTEDDLKQTVVFMQNFNLGKEKNGIIETIIGNEPKFMHFTFAEYFACEFICDKLESNMESTWKYIINHMLMMDNRGIKRFFDAKLENDRAFSMFTSKCISDTLFLQMHNSLETALDKGIFDCHPNIALFLLNNLSTYLTKDNLDDFIFLVSNYCHSPFPCFLASTHDERNHIVMKEIIKIIIRLDCTKLVELFLIKGDPIINIFMLAFGHRYALLKKEISSTAKESMNLLMDNISPEDVTKLLTVTFYPYKFTILHKLLQQRQSFNMPKYFKKLNSEQKMKVLTARDDCGRVPAHYAAPSQNFEFFDQIESLMGKEQLKIICTTADTYGEIPLKQFFEYYPYDRTQSSDLIDKFRSLCAKAGIVISCLEETNGKLVISIND